MSNSSEPSHQLKTFHISGEPLRDSGPNENNRASPGHINPSQQLQPKKGDKKMNHVIRNRLGFWVLGLCNNYGYVIMLSAAFDILRSKGNHESSFLKNSTSEEPFCNPTSTGAILIADIIPSLLIKLVSPLLSLGTNLRVSLVVLLSFSSFVIVALAQGSWLSFLGVICASMGSGLGEASFLIFSSQFKDSATISFWSSGTGGAGLLGAISYAGLTSMGLGPRTTLFLMTIVPITMAVTFWVLIKPPKIDRSTVAPLLDSPTNPLEANSTHYSAIQLNNEPNLQFSEKIVLIKSLVRYMVPLTLVYYFEYLINQGFFELVYFRNIQLPHDAQYRWYQVDYQLGVLISRSSINLIRIKPLWVLPILQFLNVIIILFQILVQFIPWIWIVLLVILWEGLLGGAAYVNTFDQIYRKYDENNRGFCLGAASIADALGITIAGFSSIYFHNILCNFVQ